MRSFKHQKSSGSGCNCSFCKLLLLMVFIIAAAYGMVIASMMSTEKGTAVVDHVQLLSSQLRTSPSSSGGGSSGGSASGTSGGDSISDTHSHPVLDPDDFLDMITHVVECKTTHGPVTIDVRLCARTLISSLHTETMLSTCVLSTIYTFRLYTLSHCQFENF